MKFTRNFFYNGFGLILGLFLLGFTNVSIAQCGGGGTFVSNLEMMPFFQTISVNTGDRYTFDGYASNTYIFSFCQGGASNLIDTQIEICDQNGTVVYDSNDDHCGLGSEITWNCSTNAVYSIVVYEYSCNASGVAAGDLAYESVTPPNEQDCLGAIPLCFSTYNTTSSYSGTGHYWNEIPVYDGDVSDDNCPGNCLLGGEVNDVWYTFTVQTTGTVSFVISPNDSSDDYDWAVYDLTSSSCMDIAAGADAMQVSCNFCGTAGDTGPSGGSSDDCQHGNTCSNYNDVLNVVAGETYVVNISNWSATQSGYSITFGGTAQIYDDQGPYLEGIIYTPYCGSPSLTIQFSERIWCTSVQPEDFTISGPQGSYEISDVWSEVCIAGAGSTYSDTYYDDVFTLELSDYLMHDGTYTLSVNEGGVDDICSNNTPMSSLNFTIDGVIATGSVTNGVTCPFDTDGAATVSALGGTAPYTYEWTNGETSQIVTNLPGGNSIVTVTDSYGVCQDTALLFIPYPPPIIVDAGSDVVLCSSGSVVLGGSPTATDGNAPYTYTWTPSLCLDNPSSPNPTATPSFDVEYVCLVQDATGCTNTDTVLVQLDPPIAMIFTITDPLCYGGSDGSAICNPSGGTPPYSYSWSNGLGSAQTAIGMMDGHDYYVTVTDYIGCQEVDTISVNDPSALQINFTVVDAECGFSNGEVSGNVIGGTNPINYLWDEGDTVASIVGLNPGNYTMSVEDANGCTATEIATVDHFGSNSVTITQLADIQCNGEYTASLKAESPSATAPLTYSWQGSSYTDQIIFNLNAGLYAVTVTDTYGCQGEAEISVDQPEILGLNIVTHDVLCAGGDDGTAEAIVNGGVSPYTYLWSTGDNENIISNLESGSYSITINDVNNCEVIGNCIITEPDDFVHVYVNTTPVLCAGQASGVATATATGGVEPYHFIWYENGYAIANGQIIQSLVYGNYSVVVEDNNGCQGDADFSIIEPTPLIIESAVQQASCMGYADGEAAISVIGGTSPYGYLWSTGDTVAAVVGLSSDNYYLTVTDANDCVQVISVFVPENPRLCLGIPNAFTPNGDGVNDTWIVEYIDNYPRANVMVYNRWGQILYNGNYMDDPWDGMLNGEVLPSGSYTYIVDLHNDIAPFTGVVVLVH